MTSRKATSSNGITRPTPQSNRLGFSGCVASPTVAPWRQRPPSLATGSGTVPWACPDHLEGLTGLRQFGVGSRARGGAVLRLSHFTSSVGEDRFNPLRFRGWVAGEIYRRPMTPIPAPGDPCAGFAAEPMKCWAMIYDGTMQADRGPEQPNRTGRWFSPRGDPASRRTVLALR